MMSHRIDWSTTDVLGQTYVNSHSGNPYSWGAQTMCGKVPSGGTLAAVNYRDQGYMLSPQVQGPDMGAFGGIQGGFTPADILTDLNTTLKARKTFWIIMQPPASNWGSTLKAGATWDQLGPFLNDPANALTNTSRPVNYT